MIFEPKLFEFSTDLHWFGFVVVFEYARGKFFFIFTWFYSEIWFRIFRMLRSWFCLLIWDWNLEINRWFVFLLLNRFRIFEILSLFFFELRLCDRTEFVASSDEFDAWIAEDKAQWWWFNPKSLRANANSIDLAWILLLEMVRVCEFVLQFLSLLWFWSNWMEREICELFVMWHWFCGPSSSDLDWIACVAFLD